MKKGVICKVGDVMVITLDEDFNPEVLKNKEGSTYLECIIKSDECVGEVQSIEFEYGG